MTTVNAFGLIAARRRTILLRAAAVSVTVLAASLTLALGMNETAAAMVSSSQRPEMRITEHTQGPLQPLVPGATTTRIFAVSTVVDSVYQMHVSINGSPALAEQLIARIDSAITGETLYKGPLTAAGFTGRMLAGDVPEKLVVDVTLPITAGNEWSRATVVAGWSFSATPLIAP